MSARDGGPAFPVGDHEALHAIGMAATMHLPAGERDVPYIAAKAQAARGASMRDYFAAKALAGCMAYFNEHSGDHHTNSSPEATAAFCYAVADAMMVARGLVAVPDNVREAIDRMCEPLDESRLRGVTATEDARCMRVIRDYVLGGST